MQLVLSIVAWKALLLKNLVRSFSNHNSSDDTVEISKKFNTPIIKIVDASSCKTIAQVRQKLLDLVKTEFIVWLDADDELLPGRAKRIVDSLEKPCRSLF